LKRSLLTELCCFVKPPKVCEVVLQGVGVLLEPSKKEFEWNDAKKMMNSRTTPFLQTLCAFDKDSITDDQLARLTKILAKDECQIERVAQVSLACSAMCLWLRGMADYANIRRQQPQ
jgi:hypothetical protein